MEKEDLKKIMLEASKDPQFIKDIEECMRDFEDADRLVID